MVYTLYLPCYSIGHPHITQMDTPYQAILIGYVVQDTVTLTKIALLVYLRATIVCRYKFQRISEIVHLAGTHFSDFSKLTFYLQFLAKIGQIANFAKFSTRKQVSLRQVGIYSTHKNNYSYPHNSTVYIEIFEMRNFHWQNKECKGDMATFTTFNCQTGEIFFPRKLSAVQRQLGLVKFLSMKFSRIPYLVCESVKRKHSHTLLHEAI